MTHRIYSTVSSARVAIRDYRVLETDVMILLFARIIAGLAMAWILSYMGILAAKVLIASAGGYAWSDWLLRLVLYSGGRVRSRFGQLPGVDTYGIIPPSNLPDFSCCAAGSIGRGLGRLLL